MAKQTYNIEDAPESSLSKLGTGLGRAARFGLRTASRLGSRALETVVGLPGDIEQLGRSAINTVSNLTTGNNLVDPEAIHATSQSLRQAHKPYTGEYLEPQGEGLQQELEKGSDAFIKDFVSYLLPTGVTTQGAKRAAQLAGLSNIAGLVTKSVTGSEGLGEAVKVGSLLVPAFLGRPKAKDLMKKAYDDAYEASKGAQISAKGIEPTLDKINRLIKAGAETPQTKELTNLIDQIEGKISKGKIPLESADRLKKQLYKIIYSGKYAESDKLEDLQKLIPSVANRLKDSIEQYGKSNPSFGTPYNRANELYSALNAGTRATKFLESFVTEDTLGKQIIKSIFRGLEYGNPSVIVTAPAIATGLHGSKKAARGLEVLFRSPTIRNDILSSIKATLTENAPALTRSLAKLEGSIERENPKGSSSGKQTYKITE